MKLWTTRADKALISALALAAEIKALLPAGYKPSAADETEIAKAIGGSILASMNVDESPDIRFSRHESGSVAVRFGEQMLGLNGIKYVDVGSARWQDIRGLTADNLWVVYSKGMHGICRAAESMLSGTGMPANIRYETFDALVQSSLLSAKLIERLCAAMPDLWCEGNYFDASLRFGAPIEAQIALLKAHASLLNDESTFRLIVDLGSHQLLDAALKIGLKPNDSAVTRRLDAAHLNILAANGFDPLQLKCVTHYLCSDLYAQQADPDRRAWKIKLAESGHEVARKHLVTMVAGMIGYNGDTDAGERLLGLIDLSQTSARQALWQASTDPKNHAHWPTSIRFLIDNDVSSEGIAMPEGAVRIHDAMVREKSLVSDIAAIGGQRPRI